MVFIWIRGTWPRVRVDQILIFNWKFLVPLVLALILIVAVLDKLIPDGTSEIARASFHLASNVLLAFITLEILRRNARRQRRIQAEQSMAAVEETENVTHEVAEAAHAH
jgi:NADH-quinone oxidoreductase subunit H